MTLDNFCTKNGLRRWQVLASILRSYSTPTGKHGWSVRAMAQHIFNGEYEDFPVLRRESITDGLEGLPSIPARVRAECMTILKAECLL
ncbi:hypothetical protein ACVFDQ_002753 [Enterobacter hormaechei]